MPARLRALGAAGLGKCESPWGCEECAEGARALTEFGALCEAAAAAANSASSRGDVGP